MESIHPDMLEMMLKRTQELNADPERRPAAPLPPTLLPPPEPPPSRGSCDEDYSHRYVWGFDTNEEEALGYHQHHYAANDNDEGSRPDRYYNKCYDNNSDSDNGSKDKFWAHDGADPNWVPATVCLGSTNKLCLGQRLKHVNPLEMT